MNTTTIVLVIVAIIVAAGLVYYFTRKRKSDDLRAKFGPEYDRVVDDAGSRRRAEADLAERQKRVESLAIKPLSPEDRERYLASWQKAQAEFVDDPKSAVVHADVLVADAMKGRGYPVTDFEQRAADISVDHPVVVDNYRAAHEIAVNHAAGKASTEDLRQAMVHYRSLFEELIAEVEPAAAKA
jgi:hypothetical protein